MKRLKLFEQFLNESDQHANDVLTYLKEVLDKYEDPKKAGDWIIDGDKGYNDEEITTAKTTTFINTDRKIDVIVEWTDTYSYVRGTRDDSVGYAGDFNTDVEITDITLWLDEGEEEYPVTPTKEMERIFFEIQDNLERKFVKKK